MALQLKAAFFSIDQISLVGNVVSGIGSGFLQVSGVTANYPLVVRLSAASSVFGGSVTSGFAFSDQDGDALIPFGPPVPDNFSGLVNFWIVTTQGASIATYSGSLSAPRFDAPYEHTNLGNWSFTQDANKNVKAQIADYQSATTFSVFESYDNGTLATPQFFKIWEVKMFGPDGSLIATNSVTPRPDGQQPFTVFPSSTVTVTGEYYFSVARKYRLIQNATPASHLEGTFSTVLTAPAVTSGGNNMFSWLTNDYWYMTDLQVNLGTRAVTHRHGTVQIKPNDTVNFAVMFHDGSVGKDPVATDLRLAVRSSSNASAYYFWANPSVTTTSVSGDIYYTITVTASDEDLLAAQNANLLSGGSDQNLLAEVQWTTTRGTFTSDTFNITVANEVVRDPDV